MKARIENARIESCWYWFVTATALSTPDDKGNYANHGLAAMTDKCIIDTHSYRLHPEA